MNRCNRKVFVIVGVFLLAAANAGAWSGYAHQLINGAAVERLPAPLREFYDLNRKEIVERANDPDLEKLKDLAMLHTIYLEAISVYPFNDIPRQVEVAYSMCRRDTFEGPAGIGALPWAIQDHYNALVAAFRQKDGAKIVSVSSNLGHYIADASMPLHATMNSDGQFYGITGVHGRIERAADLHVVNAPLHITNRGAPNDHPPDFNEIIALLRESNGRSSQFILWDSIFYNQYLKVKNADEEAYRKEVSGRTGVLMDECFESAIVFLADCWYWAWVEAGQPRLGGI